MAYNRVKTMASTGSFALGKIVQLYETVAYPLIFKKTNFERIFFSWKYSSVFKDS